MKINIIIPILVGSVALLRISGQVRAEQLDRAIAEMTSKEVSRAGRSAATVVFEHTIADRAMKEITNLCSGASAQAGGQLVIKSLTRQIKYPATDRLGHIIPGVPERTGEGPQDGGFLLRLHFGCGPYMEPRALFSPQFPTSGTDTNKEGYTSALVEFPKANIYMVADIWWGKSCDPGLVRRIYEAVLSQVKLALGEPWHGFPGRGLGNPTTARPKSNGDAQR